MKNGPQIRITENNLLQFLLYHVLDFCTDYFQAFFFVVRGDNCRKPIVQHQKRIIAVLQIKKPLHGWIFLYKILNAKTEASICIIIKTLDIIGQK